MIFLGIGTNLDSKYGNKLSNLNVIIKFLQLEKIDILNTSSIYETPSYPDKQKPKFLNIVIQIKFDLDLNKLFKKILLIEKKMGRKRTSKNEPRICDIDVIDFNQVVIDSESIILPHPRAHKRNFVLYPILQIDSRWIHPILKKNVKFLINKLDQKSRIEITRLNKNVNIKI